MNVFNRSCSYGFTGLAGEEAAFVAFHLYTSTKLAHLVVGAGKMLDPGGGNRLSNPAKYILVLFSEDALAQFTQWTVSFCDSTCRNYHTPLTHICLSHTPYTPHHMRLKHSSCDRSLVAHICS